MNGVDYASVGDYINHALAEFYKRPQIFATPTFQKYVMVKWLFNKVTLKIKSGNALEWRYMRGHDGEAVATTPFQVLPIDHVDLFSKGSSNWCQNQKRAVWNEIIMKDMSGDAELANYMDSKILNAIWGTLDYLENSPFRVKMNSGDLRTPDGIPFWFPKLGVGVEDTTGGFNGQTAVYADGTTTTTIGNTDRANVSAARTAVGTYNGMNTGALDTLRHLQNITDFTPPSDMEQYIAWSKAVWRLLSGFTVQEQYESLVNAGPDDRNGDANPFVNELTFRGMKWEKVAAMNDLADSPIYGINTSFFFPWRHTDFWMYWTPVGGVQGEPFTHYKDLFCKFNFAAVNEKAAGFCLHRVRAA